MSDLDIIQRRRGKAGQHILEVELGIPNPDIGENDNDAAFEIVEGPVALNHMNFLRKTGKRCNSWTKNAYKVRVNGVYMLGVEFQSGYRCYYPDTGSNGEMLNGYWKGILNASSGSYYVWDWIKGMDYHQF